jgi:L,D-peptidoglycan transpeptidase YkuD (ErfK/YbiS/YcfS/YnhG family)
METPYRQVRKVKHLARQGTARLVLTRASARQGILAFGPFRWRCALGPAGVRARKREGDGATPRGTFRLLTVHYRADRIARPHTPLPIRQLRSRDGWADAPGDRNYNRSVSLPYPASHERMWRDDRLYDVVVSLDHNTRPRIRGHGSCIFLHVAAPGFTPTAGCIALRRADLVKLLAAGVTAIRTT